MGYWTDYLKTFLHPRSLYQLPGVWQGQGRFGAFGDGKGLFGMSEMRDDVMDRVRYWAEECDAFQVGAAILTRLFFQADRFLGAWQRNSLLKSPPGATVNVQLPADS